MGAAAQELTSVVIVGAGPIGLALAADLGSRGIDAVVLERHQTAETPDPKIMYISVRTMELCRRLGVAEAVRNWGFPRDHPHDTVFVTSMAGYELSRIPVPALDATPPSPVSPEGTVHCPQNWFDPVLRRRAEEFDSISFRYGVELVDLRPDDDGVTAHVRDRESGATSQIRARYLVGCDGYRSTVRELLGVPMTGQDQLDFSVNILFRSAQLRRAHRFGDALRYVLIGPGGTWATLWAVDGRELWRLTVYGTDQAYIESLDPDAAVVRLGYPDLRYEILAVTRWTRRAMVAERMQRGPVFLAGDSAHAMPPNGGLGMNTGFADAINLGWKLAAVLDGWADRALLDSYEVERLPVVRRTVAEGLRNYARLTSDTAFAGLDAPTAEGAQLREQLGRRLHEQNLRAWRPMGIHLGYVYDTSPVVAHDHVCPTEIEPYVPSTAPGARAPHAWLDDGRSTLDLFGRCYTLLRIGAQPPDATALVTAAAARSMPLDVHHLAGPAVAELYEKSLVLVRPDGHVAWRSNEEPRQAAAILDLVTGVPRGAGRAGTAR